MDPKMQMSLFLLASLSGLGLFIFGLFGQSTSPTWIDSMWGIYALIFAYLTYRAWKKTKVP